MKILLQRIMKRFTFRLHEFVKDRKNKHYENKIRRRLTNHDFSILCSNCIGGVIYHRLGQRFLSPTINLWMHQKDFLKFVKDLNYYLSCNLQFVDGGYTYPVAKLGDIFVYFNHSDSKESAENDWNRRKERVNHDNLFIIMYDLGGITEEDIQSLSSVKCRNKIVLSDKKYEHIDYVCQIQPDISHEMNEHFLDTDDFGFRTFEKRWDFVSWLNTEM